MKNKFLSLLLLCSIAAPLAVQSMPKKDTDPKKKFAETLESANQRKTLNSSLNLAISNGDVELVNALLELGADPNYYIKEGNISPASIKEWKKNFFPGVPILMFAITKLHSNPQNNNHFAIVRALLSSNKKIDDEILIIAMQWFLNSKIKSIKPSNLKILKQLTDKKMSSKVVKSNDGETIYEVIRDTQKKSSEKEELQKVCAVCKKPSTSRCSICKTVRYCSRACQAKDWKNHKPKCKKPIPGAGQAKTTTTTRTVNAQPGETSAGAPILKK